MRYCTKCGAELEDDAKFCTVCGTMATEAENEKKRRKPVVPLIIGAGVLTVVVAAGIILGLNFMNGHKNDRDSGIASVTETDSSYPNTDGTYTDGSLEASDDTDADDGLEASDDTDADSADDARRKGDSTAGDDKVSGSKVNLPADFKFSESEWSSLSYVGAWLAAVLSPDMTEGSGPVSCSSLDEAQLSIYIRQLLTAVYSESEQFPRDEAAEANLGDGCVAYSEKVVNDLLASALGLHDVKPLTQVSQAEDTGALAYADGIYFWKAQPQINAYELRPYAYNVEASTVTTDAELIMTASGEASMAGLYRITWQQDSQSRFGFVLTQIEKLETARPEIAGIEASSTMISYERADKYQVSNVLDRDLSTAWVEGDDGYGEGESITITFDSPTALHGLWIAGGYRKNEATYAENARVTAYRLEFSDGTSMDVPLGSYPSGGKSGGSPVGVDGREKVLSTDGRDWQGWDSLKDGLDFISFGQEITSDYVRVTILEVQPGTVYKDTCITEIDFY